MTIIKALVEALTVIGSELLANGCLHSLRRSVDAGCEGRKSYWLAGGLRYDLHIALLLVAARGNCCRSGGVV